MIGVLMRSVEEKKNPCITINSENDGILGTVTVEPLPENP
jgi:hypothetical protein